VKQETATPVGLPKEKKEIDPSITSATIRSFRKVKFKSGVAITILSAQTGKPVAITPRSLNNYQKGILSNACDFIEGKLKGTSYEEPIKILMKITGFITTSSNHVGAYAGKLNDEPLVFLNSKTFTGSTDEFAVTVLHELLHFVNEPDDRDPTSLEEARHDIACYGLLGIPISLNHWAFTKHPHLKNELLKDPS